MNKKLFALVAAGSLAAFSNADPLDLSGWTPVTLDFTGGQPAANWSVQADNESVIQTVNADPSFFLNNLNQTSFTMDGSWRVNTTADDDYMGFVFGYQNSSNFYLFDWKRGSQGYVGATAAEGMTVKKLTGPSNDGLTDLSLAQLWENQSDLGNLEVLATNHGSSKGWAANTLYDFHLDFNLVADQFSIVVQEGATELWDVTVNDSTFTGGQFGFYNYSQAQIEYAGFEQTGGVVVPDTPPPSTGPESVPDSGSTLAILAASLGAFALLRRRR